MPDCCVLTGEIRSYDHGKALETVRMTERIFTEEAQKINATAEVTSQIHLIAYETSLESKSVTDFQKACEILGFSGELTGTFGGSDTVSYTHLNICSWKFNHNRRWDT